MHKKFADKGFVIIMVSVDPADQKDLVKQANEFLRKTQPPFMQLHLQDSDEVWSKKLDFTIPPCYFVFDRRGKWVRFRGGDQDDEVLHAELEKTIVRLVNEK